jgi:hypothetical protein
MDDYKVVVVEAQKGFEFVKSNVKELTNQIKVLQKQV